MKTLAIQLAAIKNVNVSDIKNIDTNVNTFELSKGCFMFDLTKGGKVANGSVKFMNTINNYSNCSY